VIGGGLAGITAALDCAQAGARVTLLEVRRRLGGAAYSFERDGLRIDNGQHVFLRRCVAYRALLARLGSQRCVSVQPRLEIPVLRPGAALVVLRRNRLPAPLHLAGTLARYRPLTIAQRLGAARTALALARLDPSDQALDRLTFGDWLAQHGQGLDAVGALWDLIALPTLNLPAAQASLALGAFVFRNGLLSSADAADIGFHSRTLSETIGDPAARALREAGVEVRLGWRAERLKRTASGFEVHGRGGRSAGGEAGHHGDGGDGGEGEDREAGGEQEGLSAEAAIVAVPHARAAALLAELTPVLARRLGGLRAGVRGRGGDPCPVSVRPHGGGGGARREPISGGVALGRRAGDGDERGRFTRALSARAAGVAPPCARGEGGAFFGDPRARCHVPRRAGRGGAAPARRYFRAGACVGGQLDGYRLAGDARGRRAQRTHGGTPSAPGARPRAARERERL
jgi:hypothetical protein